MTVKQLRQELNKLPDHATVAFETNEILGSSWSIDSVEERGGFAMFKSIGVPNSLKVEEK